MIAGLVRRRCAAVLVQRRGPPLLGIRLTGDKLRLARHLKRHRVPTPETAVYAGGECPFDSVVVVKPRFGSWGRDIELCETEEALRRHLRDVESRAPFRHGALVQELVPPEGFDLRVIVAGGVAVGAVKRVAAPGEWRTNIALGGTRVPTEPPTTALDLAVQAAAAA